MAQCKQRASFEASDDRHRCKSQTLNGIAIRVTYMAQSIQVNSQQSPPRNSHLSVPPLPKPSIGSGLLKMLTVLIRSISYLFRATRLAPLKSPLTLRYTSRNKIVASGQAFSKANELKPTYILKDTDS